MTEWRDKRDDATVDPGVVEPPGAHRSAGPESGLSWALAGREGRAILAGGPSAADIGAVAGAMALEPIRVYVGIDEPGGWEDHAAAAVAELDRLSAADRGAVLVAATTGAGWLDPEAVDAFEYLRHGDTALVAVQSAVSASWHAATFHPGDAREATATLLAAVHDWWAALPADDRPELYVYGLGPGARAIQDSFADARALREYGAGAVLAGTPHGTAINAELTAAREPGSPVVRPVVDGGIAYRWFTRRQDPASVDGDWNPPRIAFLQHANDPMVWAGLPILWSQPEWLDEGERTGDVHAAMQWFPLVTGVQTLADSLRDLAGPDGAGGRYGALTVEAWIRVLGDGGYTAEQLDLIRHRVAGADAPAGDHG